MKTNDIHIGELIKNKMDEIGMTSAELGRRIDTSRQNTARLLKLKSLDSEQLFKIGKALNYNFFKHYSFDNPQQNVDGKVTEIDSKIKVSIQLDLSREDILKLGLKDRVLNLLIN